MPRAFDYWTSWGALRKRLDSPRYHALRGYAAPGHEPGRGQPALGRGRVTGLLRGDLGEPRQPRNRILESGDVEEGLNAASAIGDDRLQQSQGYIVPDAFTHGSSAHRVQFFRGGLDSGELGTCDIAGLPAAG